MARIRQVAHADFVKREPRAAAQLALELQAQTRVLHRVEQFLLDLRRKREFDPHTPCGRIFENFGIGDQRGDSPLSAGLLARRAGTPFDLHRHHSPQVLLDEGGVIGIESRVRDDVRQQRAIGVAGIVRLLGDRKQHVEQLASQEGDLAVFRLNCDRLDGLTQFGGTSTHHVHIGFLGALCGHASGRRRSFRKDSLCGDVRPERHAHHMR